MSFLLVLVVLALAYLGCKIFRMPYWRMLYIVPILWIAGYFSIWIAKNAFWIGLVSGGLLIVLGYLVYRAKARPSAP